MRATLKNTLKFDGQKSGDKIQGDGDSKKCFEPNANYNKGMERENTELILKAPLLVSNMT